MATVSIYRSGQALMKGKPNISFNIADFVSASIKQNPEGGLCLVIVIKGRNDIYFCYKDKLKLQKYTQHLNIGITKAKTGIDVKVPFF